MLINVISATRTGEQHNKLFLFLFLYFKLKDHLVKFIILLTSIDWVFPISLNFQTIKLGSLMCRISNPAFQLKSCNNFFIKKKSRAIVCTILQFNKTLATLEVKAYWKLITTPPSLPRLFYESSKILINLCSEFSDIK